MRSTLLLSLAFLLSFTLKAQYGTFDAAGVKAAKATTMIVVLDAGDSPYNRTIMNAVKSEWKFTAAYEFVTVAELGAMPIDPTKTYLLKTAKVDPVKYEATFLTLVRGWKQKKGEPLQQKNNAFTSIASENELAFIMIDPKAINEQNMAPMLTIYIKHLQDYLKLVEAGKITAAWKGEGKRGGYLYEPAEVKRAAAERRTTRQATAHLCNRCGIDTTRPGLCADCSEVA